MPDNTLPMMTGFGQFGPLEMGGMFTVVKVREGLAPGDYKDPGWYRHPEGTVAYEVQGGVAGEPRRAPMGQAGGKRSALEMKVVKPNGRRGGHH
jgi:hypothetical protein